MYSLINKSVSHSSALDHFAPHPVLPNRSSRNHGDPLADSFLQPQRITDLWARAWTRGWKRFVSSPTNQACTSRINYTDGLISSRNSLDRVRVAALDAALSRSLVATAPRTHLGGIRTRTLPVSRKRRTPERERAPLLPSSRERRALRSHSPAGSPVARATERH